jgi:alpha-tubulin suppressor-like RCC1 family protein
MCIKLPELIANMQIDSIEVGSSLAVAIEKHSKRAYILGINSAGELGTGDKEVRQSFVVNEELSDKEIEIIGVGKSGFVVAIGQIQTGIEEALDALPA